MATTAAPPAPAPAPAPSAPASALGATSPAPSASYERFAGAAGIAAGVLGVTYAYSFLILRDQSLSALALMLGGVLSVVVAVALYARLVPAGGAFTLLALLLAAAGALGATLHGGYDLANALHPPATSNPDLPSQADPRGLLTFGLTGLGLAAFVALMARDARFPRPLLWLGALSALLSVSLYLGRLIVLDPASPLIAYPAVAEGFVVNPLWYLWLGALLWRGADPRPRTRAN
jgi:hypothetical protein